MTRQKLKLEFIANGIARRKAFNTSKNSLMKKLYELTTLCGIEACAIVYSEFHPQLEVWPSSYEVQRILTRFSNYPKTDQSKKMFNQESFMNERITKAIVQLEKIKKENKKKLISLLLFKYHSEGKILDNLTMLDLGDLANLITKKQQEINRRMNVLETSQIQAQVDHGQGVEMNMDQGKNEPRYWEFINCGEN